MRHPDEREAVAPCGCKITVDHIRGDRLCMCDHGRRWNVQAWTPPVEYRFQELVGW